MRIIDQITQSKNWLVKQGVFQDYFSEFYARVAIVMETFYRTMRSDLQPVFLEKMKVLFADIKPSDIPRVTKLTGKQLSELLNKVLPTEDGGC